MADSFQDRVEQYLGKGGQRARGVRVVPLTGDASDRRYLRVVPRVGAAFVLALYASPSTTPDVTLRQRHGVDGGDAGAGARG